MTGMRSGGADPAMVGPTAWLASPVWHRQGPRGRYGRCRRRLVLGA
ncbi:MAG TPA: hypothetical protein VFA45_24175 [Actinomycetes bacterium]|nr:hypothetical protein [Actinomycetes bacterium]